MIKRLWIANGIILGLALLVLIIGLVSLAGSNPLADNSQVNNGLQDPAGNDLLAAGSDGKDSELVAMARKYSIRFNPPKPPPVVKKPIKKPPIVKKPPEVKKPIKKNPPKPPPPPPPPPKKVIPPPSFGVEATLMIGETEGLAWIKPPKGTHPTLYAVGEKIDQYEIIKIEHGVVELVREEKNFTIKVPEPKIASKPLAPAVKKKESVKKQSARRSLRRQTRKSKIGTGPSSSTDGSTDQ